MSNDYNYPHFTSEEIEATEFAGFRGLAHAGQVAPDGVLTDAATGETVRLSDLWRNQALVIEFGSIT